MESAFLKFHMQDNRGWVKDVSLHLYDGMPDDYDMWGYGQYFLENAHNISSERSSFFWYYSGPESTKRN